MDKYQQIEPSLISLSFKNALARGVAHAYNPRRIITSSRPAGNTVSSCLVRAT